MYKITGKTGDWEVIIGLETHMEVLSNAKLFSAASADYKPTSPANSQVSFVDAGFPGMLPTPNAFIIDQAIRMGLGINAEINRRSVFARKQYFYPDLPQGYQISQTTPIVGNGFLDILDDEGAKKRVRIERLHIEQDAGKNVHDRNPNKSFVDLNRSGVGLMEIVSFPDLRSPTEAANYLRSLRAIARALKTSNGNMDEGSMRADVNVSVRKFGEPEFRTRCEIKNMTSFKFIQTAIEFEATRQIELYENGGEVDQETRRFDSTSGTTSTLRSKENALDYRYFPDPDLLPLILTEERIEKIRRELPELPAAKKSRYMGELGLTDYDAGLLTETPEIAEWFESAVAGESGRAKPIANWMISELFAHFADIKDSTITPAALRELVDLILDGTISGKIAKDVFAMMLDGDGAPAEIIEKHGLRQMTDTGEMEKIIDEVLGANPDKVAALKGGKTGLMGWLVGQVMKQSGGRANPELVNKLISQKI
ncbi:MAG: Asp-tRNA(Asn)/Glu-tRNA(Gln) amidotransferase subunit GatB [Rickettsiales bacterium]|jgi:aspartyl-tRNA(Asn)/glutamyl-tRNA(Gln) amidotransferase subunit B|nr:Asp-tRNA(Asn)/Glu-tRNA(Gln) amidotransferase subunit GatB [Rickettsiales bacterium]